MQIAVADPDLQKGEARSSRLWDKLEGGGEERGSQKKFFSLILVYKKWGGTWAPRAPPLDPPSATMLQMKISKYFFILYIAKFNL